MAAQEEADALASDQRMMQTDSREMQAGVSVANSSKEKTVGQKRHVRKSYSARM